MCVCVHVERDPGEPVAEFCVRVCVCERERDRDPYGFVAEFCVRDRDHVGLWLSCV